MPHSALIRGTQVGQLSRGLVRAAQGLYPASAPWQALLPDPNLAEAIAQVLAVAPAAGQQAARGQALGVVTQLEPHTPGHGLDLTRRCLLGLLCRPAATGRPGHFATEQGVVDWLLAPLSERDRRWLLAPAGARPDGAVGSLDATLVQTADDIAWVHDLDDAIAVGLLRPEDWVGVPVHAAWAEAVDLAPWSQLTTDLFAHRAGDRRRAIGALINALLVSIEVEEDRHLDEPLLQWRVQLMAPARELVGHLRRLVVRAHAQAAATQREAARGREALLAAFCVLSDHPERLPAGSLLARRWRDCEDLGAGLRGLVDLAAGLTEDGVRQLAALAEGG